MYLDPETMLPVDLETYVFDLEAANKHDAPSWNLHIDVRKDYAMKDMSPASFSGLSQRIKTDKDVCTKYKANSRVGGRGAKAAEKCKTAALYELESHLLRGWNTCECTAGDQLYFGCQTASSDSDDLYKCKYGDTFWSTFTFDNDHLLVPLINKINNHWYKEI